MPVERSRPVLTGEHAGAPPPLTASGKDAILRNETHFARNPRNPMSLRDRLSEDLKSAMKSRDQLRMDVIRMIKAAVLNKEVELKQDLDDAAMSRIMTTLIKQRKEAAEQFEKGNRQDLAAKERQEIVIIEGYLPTALSPDEVVRTVEAVVKESGASSLKDMGQVMKAVMARLAGQSVDGKVVSDLVKAALQR